MNIEEKLQVAIDSGFEELKEWKVNTKEYETAVDSLSRLADRAIELEKLKIETEAKAEEMKVDRKDRITRHVMTGIGIVVPSIITVWGTLKSLKFEEDGTITTAIGRGFINKLLPKK